MNKLLACFACSAILLTACNNTDGTAHKDSGKNSDGLEGQLGAPLAASADPAAMAALGLTERQLLDADLIDANGVELGDIEGVLRGPDGAVDHLLIEIEDSNPDRYVHIPIAGLTTRPDGRDWYVVTTMTRQELEALPAVPRRAR